jgi:hypothetical protein
VILGRLGGLLEATHARPRLLLAAHPTDQAFDAFWISGGRLVDWGPVPADVEELERRTQLAVLKGGWAGELGAHVPPNEIDELRILGSWQASHSDTPRLDLDPVPDREALREFVSAERERDHGRADLVAAN